VNIQSAMNAEMLWFQVLLLEAVNMFVYPAILLCLCGMIIVKFKEPSSIYSLKSGYGVRSFLYSVGVTVVVGVQSAKTEVANYVKKLKTKITNSKYGSLAV